MFSAIAGRWALISIPNCGPCDKNVTSATPFSRVHGARDDAWPRPAAPFFNTSCAEARTPPDYLFIKSNRGTDLNNSALRTQYRDAEAGGNLAGALSPANFCPKVAWQGGGRETRVCGGNTAATRPRQISEKN